MLLEEEPSLSAPSSPTLRSPFRQKLSHSCDDLLRVDISLQSHHTHPSIKVTSVGQREGEISSPELLEESNEESDDSESELEMININRPTNLPAETMTPLMDVLEVGKPAATYKGESDRGETGSKSEGETSKFSRLKGRIMKTVKSSSFMSKAISPQLSGEESGGDISVASRRTPSPPPLGEEGSKKAATKQRLKTNSPGLWQKMRRGTPVTPSSQASAEEAELVKEEAQKNCKSRMIFL